MCVWEDIHKSHKIPAGEPFYKYGCWRKSLEFSQLQDLLGLRPLIVQYLFVFHSVRFKTICPTVVSTITCDNDTKIFIESVMYGRTDNFTCPPTSLCDPSIDLSRKVTPICQGKSSCDINGSYDGLEKPCNTSYFNISYTCKKSEFGKMI